MNTSYDTVCAVDTVSRTDFYTVNTSGFMYNIIVNIIPVCCRCRPVIIIIVTAIRFSRQLLDMIIGL